MSNLQPRPRSKDHKWHISQSKRFPGEKNAGYLDTVLNEIKAKGK